MKLIKDKILYEYETEPMIILAKDEKEHRYLALAVDMDMFLVVNVSGNDYEDFLQDKKDLLDIVLKSEQKGLVENFNSRESTFVKLKTDIPKEWMPIRGFKLNQKVKS